MLKLRLATALILGATVLAAVLFLQLELLFAFFYIFVFVGCCEWAKLAGVQPVLGRVVFALSPLALCVPPLLALMALAGWFYVVCASVVFWAAAWALVGCFPRGSLILRSKPTMLAAGLLALGGAWMALYGLLLGYGTGHVVWLFLAVALADSAAYFAGRRFGRRQLAAAVSPGKTWEGLMGAALAMVACAAGGAWFFDGGLLAWLVIGAAVLAAGVVGDLFVSALKRTRSIKDTGAILPGHGGVLDRIDALLAAAPVFLLALMADRYVL